MKTAKKLLAVVLAFGLVACLSALAFAAEPGTFSLDATKSADGRTLVATLYAHEYTGLTSGKVTLTYSGAKLESVTEGVQAKDVNKSGNSAYTFDYNADNPGKVICAYHFREPLMDAAGFASNKEGTPVTIDTANLDLVIFRFKVDENAAASNISVSMTSKNTNQDNPLFTADLSIPVEIIPETTEPAPTEQPTTSPAPTDPTTSVNPTNNNPTNNQGETTTCRCRNNPCETTTGCCCKNKPCETTAGSCCRCHQKVCCCKSTSVKTDGGKDTGDNNVIAVVACVIALAGAAVVVTKKRK